MARGPQPGLAPSESLGEALGPHTGAQSRPYAVTSSAKWVCAPNHPSQRHRALAPEGLGGIDGTRAIAQQFALCPLPRSYCGRIHLEQRRRWPKHQHSSREEAGGRYAPGGALVCRRLSALSLGVRPALARSGYLAGRRLTGMRGAWHVGTGRCGSNKGALFCRIFCKAWRPDGRGRGARGAHLGGL